MGYIVGLNIGILVVSGGIISWNIAIPIYSAFFLDGNAELAARVAGASAEDAAYAIWSAQIRYLGVGAMLVGGVWALISIRESLLSGIRSGLAAARAGAAGAVVSHTERDLPMNAILIGTLLFTLPLFALYQNIVGDIAVSLPMTIIMIVAGFLFVSVSAYMAGLVGSSNNPVSGITICTILFASLVLMLLMGRNAALGPVAAIMIGAVVCCAACIGGDNLQDLKCGYIVGATPWKQQVMLAIGAASSALVMAPVLNLLAQGLRHRRADGGAPRSAARAAGDADGLGRQGHVRRRVAVGHDRDRRRHRRRGDRVRPVAEGPQLRVPRAGARRRGRHLPAARALGADLRRRPDRAPRRAPARRARRDGRGRARQAQRHAVRGGPDHR